MNPARGESQELRLFDETVLRDNVDADAELFRTLLEVFAEDRPKLLVAMEEALDQGSAPGLESAAHSIKGALGVLGAMPAKKLADRLETAGREGAIATGRDLFPSFREAVVKTETQLRDFLSEWENEKAAQS